LILADLIDGIPHSGEAHELVGHEQQVSSILEQYASGRMHHALLLSGPKGIGKVTMALRLAAHFFRFPEPVKAHKALIRPEAGDPVQGKIGARSHPNLLHLTRPWDQKAKKFKTRLTVDEIRQTVPFFGTARGEDGWRVAIVDALDDMNANASNALLKILEEPPEKTVFFIIAHSMGSVMPTIRSRCQHVPMKSLTNNQVLAILNRFNVLDGLGENDQQLLVSLSEGSVRRAIILAQEDGLELYKSFRSVCENLARPDWTKIQGLTDIVVQRGREDRYKLLLNFADDFMQTNATRVQEGDNTISSLARWAEVWEKTRNSARSAESYNLDRKQVILNLFHDMGEAARP
ncbi:MAG: DNA polymerase III subunit delta', partial [Pseudomonadota bacterium]